MLAEDRARNTMPGRIMCGFVAAAASGVFVGAVARVLMRLVAVAAEQQTKFSWFGTFAIFVIFAAAMLPGALVAALSKRKVFQWLLLGGGAVFLCFPAAGIASDEVSSTATFTTGQWLGVIAAGAGVFSMIVALPVVTLRLVNILLLRSGLS